MQYVCVTVASAQGTETQEWLGSSVAMERCLRLALALSVATAPTSHEDRYLSSTTTGNYYAYRKPVIMTDSSHVLPHAPLLHVLVTTTVTRTDTCHLLLQVTTTRTANQS